jgi:zinc protease
MRRALIALALFAMSSALRGAVKLPPYTREVLPNGVVLDLMQRSGVPLVGFRVLVKGGAEADPPRQAGLTSVTAQLLRKGTSKRTSGQFSQELDYLGGTFSTGFDDPVSSATTISAEFLSKDFDRGLDLLADAVLHPAFPEAEVSKLIAQRVDGARASKDNPQAAIGNYFQSFFFGPDHAYGHPSDERTLASIQRQDILDQHKRLYCGKNMVVIVAGDFDPTAAKSKLTAVFGAVPQGSAYEWRKQAPLAGRAQLLLVDKPDATQTYFYIAQPGIERKNPDRVALMLVNTLFGGRFTSMLNDELRVNTGLTYGANSRLQQPRLPGSITIATYTKVDSTSRAIDLALDILKRLGQKGITAEQLASAKAYTRGTYPTQHLETSDQLAVLIGELELYGLDRSEVDDLFTKIDAVSLAQANDVARKYYKSENLTLVLLGPAAKIRESIAKYDPKPVELSIKQPGYSVQ